MNKPIAFVTYLLLLSVSPAVRALGPNPVSLQNVPTPPVPGLLDSADPIVVNKTAAIVLGKALFWDVNVGSDGQACASCHFNAGADARTKNQINPGQNSSHASGQVFSSLPSGGGGPNYTLNTTDFPLHQFSDPTNNASTLLYSTDDVIGSQGSFSGQYQTNSRFTDTNDQCVRAPDSVFNVNNVGVRKVTPRNAPSVINAVFNFRNFWDGRANNVFNGGSPWGDRDPNAGVWVKLTATTVAKQRLSLMNSALASQALSPPVFNNIEMGCDQRLWPDIGRKLLLRQPLQYQQVHYQDSVLGALSSSSASALNSGLKTTYQNLIMQAFNRKYWSYAGIGQFGMPLAAGQAPYNQMEANFSLFFGLAIQLYESTLVSDQSPFDLSPVDANLAPTWTNINAGANTNALVTSLKNGFNLFVNNNCSLCHTGPDFTLAAMETNSTLLTPTPGRAFGPSATPIAYGPDAFGPHNAAASAGVTQYVDTVTRNYNTNLTPNIMDFGFANIGVAQPADDPGVAGLDPFGNSLAYSDQYVDYLLGNSSAILDPLVTSNRACDFLTPLSINVSQAVPGYFTQTDGIVADGSREGALKTQNCANPITAFIPTVPAAEANLSSGKLSTGNVGAFKIPSLRNVELTGPYMHNGDMATLPQVLQLYARHGNFISDSLNFNIAQILVTIAQPQNTTDLVNFLISLTDDRVRYQQAPFDHPQITINSGVVGDQSHAVSGNPLSAQLAQDQKIQVPAVGASGLASSIKGFLSN